MCARGVVVGGVFLEHARGVAFVDGNDFVEAFATNRSDHALDVGVLPRASRRDGDVFDAESFEAPQKHFAVDAVVVAKKMFWHRIPGTHFGDLPSGPRSRGKARDARVQDFSSVVIEYDQAIEQAKREGWDDEEVDGDDFACVIFEERLPGLRGRFWRFNPIFSNGRFADAKTQHLQFRLDAWRTPSGVLAAHATDEFADFARDRRAAALFLSALQSPEELKAFTMPTHYGVGLNDAQMLLPARAKRAEQNPEESIGARGHETLGLVAFVDGELVLKGKDLEFQIFLRAKAVQHANNNDPDPASHAGAQRSRERGGMQRAGKGFLSG